MENNLNELGNAVALLHLKVQEAALIKNMIDNKAYDSPLTLKLACDSYKELFDEIRRIKFEIVRLRPSQCNAEC